MTLQPVTSNMISAAGYDPGRQVLAIRFTKGGEYTYSGVPQEVYDAFLAAESKGKFFLSVIKGAYDFTKGGAS